MPSSPSSAFVSFSIFTSLHPFSSPFSFPRYRLRTTLVDRQPPSRPTHAHLQRCVDTVCVGAVCVCCVYAVWVLCAVTLTLTLPLHYPLSLSPSLPSTHLHPPPPTSTHHTPGRRSDERWGIARAGACKVPPGTLI